MKEIIREIFGEGKDLSALQMGSRAFVVFFIALVIIQLAGKRAFGKKAPFDNILHIMLGAVLSRAIVGASPFFPTIIACLVLVLIHWLLAKLSLYNKPLSRYLKGKEKILFDNGTLDTENMKRSLVDEDELMESIRLTANLDSLEKAEKIYMEGTGEISVVKKQPEK